MCPSAGCPASVASAGVLAAVKVRTRLSPDPPVAVVQHHLSARGRQQAHAQVADPRVRDVDRRPRRCRPAPCSSSPARVRCRGSERPGSACPATPAVRSAPPLRRPTEISSDQRLSRPVSAGARSCTISRHAPCVLRPRSVASAGSVVSSKVTFRSWALPPRPFGCSSITVPHGVVSVTRRSPR